MESLSHYGQTDPTGVEEQPPHAKHQGRCLPSMHPQHAPLWKWDTGPPTCASNVDSTPSTCAAWGLSCISSGRTIYPTTTFSRIPGSLLCTLSWSSGASGGLAMCCAWRTAPFSKTSFRVSWHQAAGEWGDQPSALKTLASATWRHAR